MDTHAPCYSAWEKEKSRADFAEARLTSLEHDIRYLSHQMDAIGGHEVHETLGRKTLGGAVRRLIIKDD